MKFSRLVAIPAWLWLVVFLLAGVLVGAGVRWVVEARAPRALPAPTVVASPTGTATPTATPTASPSPTPPPAPTTALAATPTPPALSLTFPRGLTVLALQEGAYSQLFAYADGRLPLTRLTADPADHITPALSPDGRTVAYALHRQGRWSLALLTLADGTTTTLPADGAAYVGAPSWSPDGLWLAYERYADNNLDIFIRDRAGEQQSIRLTANPAADYAPAWAPQGRLIAFVSTRAGAPQVFLADLDQAGEARFRRLSRPEDGPCRHPAWSPDGRYLAWSQTRGGVPLLMVWDAAHPERPPRAVGEGWWPQWGAEGTLGAVVRLPNGDALTAYALSRRQTLPLLSLPGAVRGFTIGKAAARLAVSPAIAQMTPTPWWTPVTHPAGPGGRLETVPLKGVKAPYPKLSDAADEAFAALRALLAQKAGWDVLGTLDNAFVPLTAPLPPGLGQDWLYTGRAFALPTTPIQAGWMVVVREDLPPYTYWRVFVRAARQDGSLGEPLHALPWDFDARFAGDVTAFEQGGAYAAAVPPGFWVNVTALAQTLGWERLPALPDWRHDLPGARFNEFALRQGLTWEEAMLQLYPREAILTPTPHPTPNIPILTPTPTPEG